MFLYLGDGKYKRNADIIGIFDMDSATVCMSTRKFLSAKEKYGKVESDGELPKSFLLCEKREGRVSLRSKRLKKREKEKKDCSVFLSRLSSSVLAARTARVNESVIEEN